MQDKLPTNIDQLSDEDRAFVERSTHPLKPGYTGYETIDVDNHIVNAYFTCDRNDNRRVERVVALVDPDTGEFISAPIEEVRILIEDNLREFLDELGL